MQVTAQYADTTVTPVISQYIALPNAASASAQPVSNVGVVQPQAPDGALASMGQSALSSIKFF
jgi:hypothetical protein